MMFKNFPKVFYAFIGVLVILFAGILIKGCKSDSSSPSGPTVPSAARAPRVVQPVRVAVNQGVDRLENISGSGIDATFSWLDDLLTIAFSQPVSFAALKTGEQTEGVMLQAFDASENLVDLDVASSELHVFGGDVVRLVLLDKASNVRELSFIPQL
jgi:hypothetical protein